MNQVNWSNNDYQNGLIFISNYEDKIDSKTIIATDKGVIPVSYTHLTLPTIYSV